MIPDSRREFNESWLTEMLFRISSVDAYNQLMHNINDRKRAGSRVQQVKNNLYKIQGMQIAYYWYEIDSIIALATELEKKPQSLIVNLTGKHPGFEGKAPFASNLYTEILNDNDFAIRILSDKQLSDEGLSIWKKLLSLGNQIGIYDTQSPGQTFKIIKNNQELESYFSHTDPNFSRYQYVLARPGEMLAETQSFFNTRRYRELCGMLLT